MIEIPQAAIDAAVHAFVPTSGFAPSHRETTTAQLDAAAPQIIAAYLRLEAEYLSRPDEGHYQPDIADHLARLAAELEGK